MPKRQLYEVPLAQRPDVLSGTIKEAIRYAAVCDQLGIDEIETLVSEAIVALLEEGILKED